MMNRTGSFREAVTAVQKRFPKVENDEKPEELEDFLVGSDKNRILPSSSSTSAKKRKRRKDGYEERGKVIVENMTRLKEFLAENRDAYLDVMNNECHADAITDIDRDRIDAGAQSFVPDHQWPGVQVQRGLEEERQGHCQRSKSGTSRPSPIFWMPICAPSARFMPIKKPSESKKNWRCKRLSRLEIKARGSLSSGGYTAEHTQADESGSRPSSGSDGDDEEVSDPVLKRRRKTKVSASINAGKHSSPDHHAAKSEKAVPGYQYSSDDDPEGPPEQGFSPEEVQLLEQENAELFEDLMSLKDSVQQIENKVVKIAELQEVFTSKVLQQKDDIDLIAGHAVASTGEHQGWERGAPEGDPTQTPASVFISCSFCS